MTKLFEHRPISELLAIVRNDFRKWDQEGLIDEGTLIKTVQYCNDKMGIPIREVRQVAIPVEEFRATLPLDFEKLYYVCALNVTNTLVQIGKNPFDNTFDSDMIYEANLTREQLGCVENYQVVINRLEGVVTQTVGNWVELDIKSNQDKICHIDCPNKRRKGKYSIEIKDDHIETPFRAGTLYLMYIGMMRDGDGNITFPFHPLVTPFYEWTIKEKIISDAIFNSDATNLGELFKLAQQERVKAWLDAYNFTVEKGFGEYTALQRKKELSWYKQYFLPLQNY